MKSFAIAALACTACALLCGQLAPFGGAPPGIHVAPPVTAEEAALLTKIRQISQKLGTAPQEDRGELQAALEEHFDYLTQRAEDRLVEFRKRIELATQSLARRKAARSELVQGELSRIVHDRQAISFYPETLSLLKSSGGPSPRQQTGRPIEKAAE